MINKIKKYFEKLFFPSTNTFVILNEIQKNKDNITCQKHVSSGVWNQFQFRFTEPVSVWVSSNSPNQNTQFLYEMVYEIVLIEFSNCFLDCRLKFLNAEDEKQFYILNNIYKFEFKIETK